MYTDNGKCEVREDGGEKREFLFTSVSLQYQYTCCFKYLLPMWLAAMNTANIQYMPASATNKYSVTLTGGK